MLTPQESWQDVLKTKKGTTMAERREIITLMQDQKPRNSRQIADELGWEFNRFNIQRVTNYIKRQLTTKGSKWKIVGEEEVNTDKNRRLARGKMIPIYQFIGQPMFKKASPYGKGSLTRTHKANILRLLDNGPHSIEDILEKIDFTGVRLPEKRIINFLNKPYTQKRWKVYQTQDGLYQR